MLHAAQAAVILALSTDFALPTVGFAGASAKPADGLEPSTPPYLGDGRVAAAHGIPVWCCFAAIRDDCAA